MIADALPRAKSASPEVFRVDRGCLRGCRYLLHDRDTKFMLSEIARFSGCTIKALGSRNPSFRPWALLVPCPCHQGPTAAKSCTQSRLPSVVLSASKKLAYLLASLVQLRFGGSDRAPKDFGDLVMLVPAHIVEDKHRFVASW